jgi:hypothetical protein
LNARSLFQTEHLGLEALNRATFSAPPRISPGLETVDAASAGTSREFHSQLKKVRWRRVVGELHEIHVDGNLRLIASVGLDTRYGQIGLYGSQNRSLSGLAAAK